MATTDPRVPRGRPRTTGALTCDRCGRSTNKIRVQWPDGAICGTCFHTATRTHGTCDHCTQQRLLPGRAGHQRLCRACAGITTDLDCHRCGAEGEHHRRGLCTRCTLSDDLSRLLHHDDRDPDASIAGFITALCAADRPESIHTWMRNPAVRQLLTALGEGTITLDHHSLDHAPAGATREHLRALLVHHGLLPHRDATLVRFQTWLEARLAATPDTVTRQPLERFATWHHLRRLRSASTRGDDITAAAHSAKQEITQAGLFLAWLTQTHDRTIATCRQADIDQWLSSGPTTRHHARTFIIWATRQNLAPGLSVAFRTAKTTPLTSHERRLALIADCIDGADDTRPYRVAGLLVLLYAQPLTRIAALRVDDVRDDDPAAATTLRLGSEPAVLPDVFADLLRRHLRDRPNMRTGNTGGSPWLFPSTRPGQHLHPNTIMTRLRDLGINIRGARNAALRELTRQAPAPIVATQLGYSHQVTARHAALAAEPMTRYAALRSTRSRHLKDPRAI